MYSTFSKHFVSSFYLLIYYNSVFLSYISSVFILTEVDGHACLLWERPDPSHGDILRWALRYEDICFCQIVVKARNGSLCPRRNKDAAAKWQFIESPESLTMLTSRENWNTEALDYMLNRPRLCGELQLDSH